MPYATADEIAASEIPVIDIGVLGDGAARDLDDVAAQMRAAAENVGFFYVRNHGIPADLIDHVLALARVFFSSSPQNKKTAEINRLHRGFLGIGQATMPGESHPDLKESFVWGLEVPEDDPDHRGGNPMIGPNNWPNEPAGMATVLNRYFEEANACGRRLLRAFAVGLGAAPGRFAGNFSKPISRGAVIYYPPQPPDLGSARFGVGPHTDYRCLTLLHQDPVGGLQVQGRDGRWLAALPIEGTLVVNVGDLLARWSNDRFASTPHRVVNTSGGARYSLAVFVDPDWGTEITPVVMPGEHAHYPPVRCGDYIQSRYDEAFAYRKEENR